jgi:hypothetical protein
MLRKQPVEPPLRITIAEAAILLVAPILGFLLLHFDTVHQKGRLDPYFYTAYIHNFQDLFHRSGLTYYSVRFGLILPAKFFTALFGPIAGFLILRYVLALVFGFSLYAAVKQYLSAPVAMATALVGMTSPFLARSLLWDHPDGVGAVFVAAAVCWSLLASNGNRGRALMAGFAVGIAGNCNVFTLAVYAPFVAAYAIVGPAHGIPLRRIARQLAISAAAALAVTFAGAIYYGLTVGHWEIFTITLTTARGLSAGGMKAWRAPGFAWILNQRHVLIPVWLGLWTLIRIRTWRTAFGPSVMALYGLFVTAFYFVHQFLLSADTLQLWYYFSYAAAAVFFLFALVCETLWQAARLRPAAYVGLVTVCCAAPWIAYSFGLRMPDVMGFGPFLAVAAAALLAGVVADRLRSRVAAVATILLLCGAFVSGFRAHATIIHPRSQRGDLELDLYRASLELMREAPPVERSGRMLFWYNSRKPYYFDSLQSTYLWGYSKLNGSAPSDPGLPILTPAEEKVLASGDIQTLALLAGSTEEMDQALAALRQHHFLDGEARRREIVSGDYHFYWVLVDLRTRRDAAF